LPDALANADSSASSRVAPDVNRGDGVDNGGGSRVSVSMPVDIDGRWRRQFSDEPTRTKV